MIEVKNSFLGGMDLDTSPFQLRKDVYIDALNITRDAVSGNQDLVITNIIGNQLVGYSYPSENVNDKVIGAYANTLRNTVIFMRYSVAGYHGVYEYNRTSGAITKIFECLTDSATDILGFNTVDKITSICIYNREEGDLLYFLDCLGRPTLMDITLFKAGTYTPVTRSIIDAGKLPPLAPPSFIYSNDTTHRSNNLLNSFFRFKQRWVYDSNQKSSWSPISQVAIPTKILDNTYTNVITNNNLITVSLDSGGKDVKAVEIAMSYAHKANEWSDFVLVDSINKSEQSISDDTTFAFSFYNDSAYPLLDQTDSNALFYYIPDNANCMILANGNVLVMGGITEGYDRTLSPNVTLTINTFAAGSGGGSGSLNGSLSSFVVLPIVGWAQSITFSGTPAVGTVVTVKVKRKSDHTIVTASTYTTVIGDTSASVVANLIANEALVNLTFGTGSNPSILAAIVESSTYETIDATNVLQLTITPPTTSATTESLATWKWSTSRRIGIVYFDQKGKTNGVLYDAKIVFPAYAENGSHEVLLPYINVKIYHTPPDWAYSYQFVITKEPTRYLFWHTVSVNTTEAGYIYFEVTNFTVNADRNPTTSTVLSYSFEDGDRMRLIRRMSDQNVFADTYDASIEGLLAEPSINGVVQTGKSFIKIKSVAPLSTVDYTSNYFVIEIYRPSQKIGDAENEVFYEFGQQFDIINPTESTRVHGGNVTNQDITGGIPAESNLYNGDSYFRSRSIYLTTSGIGTFYCQDRNVVDFYKSEVSSVDGRPSAIDVNAKRQYFGALLRFGQAYQANTNINGLNAFYAADFEEVDYSLGSVRRLTTRERFIRVFQDYKIGMMPLFSQINKTTNGDVVVQTDKLLNPIQYYTGNFGIGTASESLASYNNADYVTDNNRGVILRVSNDGNTPISILYKVNSWATEKLPLRTGNYKIYGGYDPKSNNYIAALEATNTDDAATISFDEETNVFESFLSYHPEMIVTLGTLLISFKNGNLYTHDSDSYNTFYGTAYDSYIVPVFNEKALEKKTWIGLNEVSSDKWDCPLIYSNAISYGTQRQETNLLASEFQNKESNFSASIKRDVWSRGGKYNGAFMKGNYLAVKFRKNNATNLITLNLISVKFNDSPIST